MKRFCGLVGTLLVGLIWIILIALSGVEIAGAREVVTFGFDADGNPTMNLPDIQMDGLYTNMFAMFIAGSVGMGVLMALFSLLFSHGLAASATFGGFFLSLGLGLTFSAFLIVALNMSALLAFPLGMASVIGGYCFYLWRRHPKQWRALGEMLGTQRR